MERMKGAEERSTMSGITNRIPAKTSRGGQTLRRAYCQSKMKANAGAMIAMPRALQRFSPPSRPSGSLLHGIHESMSA